MKKFRAFTLIELLIAFSISTILLGSIYFFYISFVKTGSKTMGMAEKNLNLNTKLEGIIREMTHAVELTALYPDRIAFKRKQLPAGELSVLDLETSKFETVQYKVVHEDGKVKFFRQEGFGKPEILFTVQDCDREVFKGYVLADTADASFKDKNLPFPSFTVFDTKTQNSVELSRIPIVKITLNIEDKRDKLHVINKVFFPVIYSELVEPDWNEQ